MVKTLVKHVQNANYCVLYVFLNVHRVPLVFFWTGLLDSNSIYQTLKSISQTLTSISQTFSSKSTTLTSISRTFTLNPRSPVPNQTLKARLHGFGPQLPKPSPQTWKPSPPTSEPRLPPSKPSSQTSELRTNCVVTAAPDVPHVASTASPKMRQGSSGRSAASSS